MIYELAEFEIIDGQGAEFEAAVQKAVPLFQRAKGCKSMRLERVIERANTYMLVIVWETLENHTVDFRGSEDFQAWRGMVGPYFANAPRVEHTSNVVAGF
ncbi:antibiotic biosynthesis monooxygenase family protein [Pseudoduganella sp. S-14]|jgi:heme-degrading monooxygenase HmoA|uniref:antibiotic biosynthesis monooxygenase family protein n=1 Tax=Pseudoduganella sp. S-14 TaxID=3404065 RepID=UPI003CEA9783